MSASIIIVGWSPIGKRVAEAVSAQPDMMVQGVVEADGRLTGLIRARGHQILPASAVASLGQNSVVVQSAETAPPANGRIILAPHAPQDGSAPLFSALSIPELFRRHDRLQAATANTLAFARLAAALRQCGTLRRWYSTVLMPARSAPIVDGLDPLETDIPEDLALARELAEAVPEISLARVAVPYTHSQLHLMKIDFEGGVARGEVLESLESSSRITVGHAKDGWRSTADLQEFCRNLGRPHGARPEVFIWHESIRVEGNSLFLMMDVEPDSVPVPEMIDAIRLMTNPSITISAAAAVTDSALQLGAPFKTFSLTKSCQN